MTEEEIRTRRNDLEYQLKEAQAKKERVLLEMRILHTHCDHPKKHKYSAMGELGDYCPDCGWQT